MNTFATHNEAMIPSVELFAQTNSPAPATMEPRPDVLSQLLARLAEIPGSRLECWQSERALELRNGSSPKPAGSGQVIYVIDDLPDLTNLYATILEATGYQVKTFNDRSAVLTTLQADETKPELLITDYFGHAMPTEQLIDLCLVIHPTLRILIASGCCDVPHHPSRRKIDRFILKPFTPEELRREVFSALTTR